MAEKLNTPEIRFEGFTDPWEQRKLGELCTISKGHGYSKANIRDAGTPLILYGRLYTQYESRIDDVDTFAVEQEGSLLSKGNEVIVPASGETAEDIAIASSVRRSGIIFGGDLNVVTPVSKLDPDYTALAITYSKAHDDLAKRAQGKSVVHVHGNDIAEVEISYPSESEQKRISTVVLGLDNLITLHQRKHDKLCTMKRSMLDKMFPKPGETEPEIRFKGFTDPWEQRKLNECLTVSSEKNSIGAFKRNDVLSVSKDFGVINQIAFQGRSFAGADLSNYGVLNQGEIVYTKSPLKDNPFGIIKSNKSCSGIVSTLYAIYRPLDNTLADFIDCYFSQDARVNNYLHPLISKGAKNDMKVSAENALKGMISIPSVAEQKQICGLLAQLDSLITLHQRKLDLLKNTKKSLLDKMFV